MATAPLAATTKIADVSGNSPLYRNWGFGDIESDSTDGTLYMIWGNNKYKELASFQTPSGPYTTILSGKQNLAKFSALATNNGELLPRAESSSSATQWMARSSLVNSWLTWPARAIVT
jgi:hypothetical protein